MLAAVLAALALAAPYLFNALVLPHLSKDFTVGTPLGSPQTIGAFVTGIVSCVLAVAAFVVSVLFRRSVRRQMRAESVAPASASAGRGRTWVSLAAVWATGLLAALYTARLLWVLFWLFVFSRW